MPQRYLIVAVTSFAAMWLYIDRVCISTLADDIKADLLLPIAPEPTEADQLSDEELAAAKKRKREKNPSLGENVELTPGEVVAAKKKKWADNNMSYALGAFFFTYALFQIPMGSLADRYGARRVLALSIAAWSLVTMATGFVGGMFGLLAVRLLLGVSEAGAYPAAAGLVKNWARPDERGRFSSIVAIGGRIGGASAPWLTAALAGALAGVAVVELLYTPAVAEGVAPEDRAKANWRGVFVVYGLCGLAVALIFWLFIRDRPPQGVAQPAPAPASADEVAAIGGAAVPVKPPRTFYQRLGLLARTRNMWLFGAMQFAVNVSWVFLVTLLPTYLNEQFHLPLEQRGQIQSLVLGIGLTGMATGGLVTDSLRRRLGPRLGRTVPLGAALGGCSLAMFLIPAFSTVWMVVATLTVMAFLVDLHNPTIWSFAQDVGGKNVGAALGWGNMWGNFGGALSPILLTAIRLEAGWNAAFVFCGFVFAAAAVCGLMLDATKPVDPDEPT